MRGRPACSLPPAITASTMGQVHGSNGYLVEEHPLLLTIAALLVLVVLWVILRGR